MCGTQCSVRQDVVVSYVASHEAVQRMLAGTSGSDHVIFALPALQTPLLHGRASQFVTL